MGIEGINNVTGVNSYQTNTKITESAQVSSNTEVQTEEIAEASTHIAQDIMELNTKDSSNMENETDNNSKNSEAQQLQIKKAVEEINKKAKNSEAIFGVHDKTNRVTIKIVDKQTKEIIKEYPPEKTLDMIARVWEMAGLMVDERR